MLCEALDTAISAMEKQLPKKADCEYDDEFTCPSCGKITGDYDVRTIYRCPECVQLLDWGK